MNKKTLGTLGSVAGFAVLASAILWASVGIQGGSTPTQTPSPAAVSVYEINGFADAPPKATPTPAAAPAVAEEAAAPSSGPVLCPDGTTANAVDGAGNESNCIEDGPGGGQCVAFDEANNCTQYYKP